MAILYYVDRYCDETMPCPPSLEAWADWLARPDPTWGRDAATSEGEILDVYTMEELEDLVATFDGQAWISAAAPEGADFFALRFGPGMGWDADTTGPTTLAEFHAALDELEAPTEGEERRIAVCREKRDTVRYRFTIEGGRPALIPVADLSGTA